MHRRAALAGRDRCGGTELRVLNEPVAVVVVSRTRLVSVHESPQPVPCTLVPHWLAVTVA